MGSWKIFEKMIADQTALPNQYWRFCTTILKLIPIFEYCYPKFGSEIIMRLGIRFDEMERMTTIDTNFDFPTSCNLYGQKRQNWENVTWRNLEFPLVNDNVFHKQTRDFWKNENDVVFAEDSNCQFCFWKDFQQIRKNYDSERSASVMYWAGITEEIKGSTFKKEMSMLEASKIGLQLGFQFGTGSEGCKSGWCGG